MAKRSGIWRFSGPLRITANITAGIYIFYFLLTWGLALAGETELAFDWAQALSSFRFR